MSKQFSLFDTWLATDWASLEVTDHRYWTKKLVFTNVVQSTVTVVLTSNVPQVLQANRLMEPSTYHVESYFHDLQPDMACVILSSLWLANVVELYLPIIFVIWPYRSISRIVTRAALTYKTSVSH